MAPTAGWYDDPRDAEKLRYWDGAAWTEHVTPKQPSPPVAEMPVFPGAVEAQQQNWQYGQPAGQPQQEQQQPQQTEPEQQQQQPQPWPQQQQQPPWPPQQQQQQPWPPGQQPPSWPPQQQWQQPWPPAPIPPPGGVYTPDGARVTTWGKRFAARLLDVIFVTLGSLPLTGYFFFRAFQAVIDQMDNGTYDSFSPNQEVVAWEMVAVGIILVCEVAYEVFSLRRWGATPGKRIVGISVRRWDRGGLLPWPNIARRAGFMFGLSALGFVPLVGVLISILALLNYLFPLWDKRRQALHDKVANTVVVEGDRPRTP